MIQQDMEDITVMKKFSVKSIDPSSLATENDALGKKKKNEKKEK